MNLITDFETKTILQFTTKHNNRIFYGPYADIQEAMDNADSLMAAHARLVSVGQAQDSITGYVTYFINVPKETISEFASTNT